jgi:hypothetical protein
MHPNGLSAISGELLQIPENILPSFDPISSFLIPAGTHAGTHAVKPDEYLV